MRAWFSRKIHTQRTRVTRIINQNPAYKLLWWTVTLPLEIWRLFSIIMIFIYKTATHKIVIVGWLVMMWYNWHDVQEIGFTTITGDMKNIIYFINDLLIGCSIFFILHFFKNWFTMIFYVPKPFWRLNLQPIYSGGHGNILKNPFSGVLERLKSVLT